MRLCLFLRGAKTVIVGNLFILLASPTGFEPVGLQSGPLIPKYLGLANYRFKL